MGGDSARELCAHNGSGFSLREWRIADVGRENGLPMVLCRGSYSEDGLEGMGCRLVCLLSGRMWAIVHDEDYRNTGLPVASAFAQRRNATRRERLSTVTTTSLMPCAMFSAQHAGTLFSTIQMTRTYSVLATSLVHGMETPVLPCCAPRAGVGALRCGRETARVIAGRIIDATYLSTCGSRQSQAQIETSPLR